MLLLGSRLLNTPVMSLQTGTQLAYLKSPIINPANLKIIAYEVDGPLLVEKPSFIRVADIREYGRLGMIINSNDELLAIDDVIAVKKYYEGGFKLIGMSVIDEHKHKLGKVGDYTVDTSDYLIRQLDVRHGWIRSLNETSSLVNRTQIIEINDTQIIVRSAKKKSVEPVMQNVRREYVNPFRSPGQSPAPPQVPPQASSDNSSSNT